MEQILPYGKEGQLRYNIDAAGVQKRKWMELISIHSKFENGLDAFGGIGYSGFYYADMCKSLTIIEKDADNCVLIEKNLKETGKLRKGIKIINTDNLEYLKTSTKVFDFIDFDPYGSPRPQLSFLNNIFTKGLICITSGEIMQVTRNLNGAQKLSPSPEKYIGKKGYAWAEDIFIPYVENLGLTVIKFYNYHTSIRVIAHKNYNYKKIKKVLSIFPTHIGWFSHYANKKEQKTLF